MKASKSKSSQISLSKTRIIVLSMLLLVSLFVAGFVPRMMVSWSSSEKFMDGEPTTTLDVVVEPSVPPPPPPPPPPPTSTVYNNNVTVNSSPSSSPPPPTRTYYDDGDYIVRRRPSWVYPQYYYLGESVPATYLTAPLAPLADYDYPRDRWWWPTTSWGMTQSDGTVSKVSQSAIREGEAETSRDMTSIVVAAAVGAGVAAVISVGAFAAIKGLRKN